MSQKQILIGACTFSHSRSTSTSRKAQTGQIAVWGKNLADEEYKVYGADFGIDQGFGYAGNSFGTPRSYAIHVIYED